MMRRWLLLGLVLVSLLPIAGPQAVLAQAPLSFTVRAGYDGTYRIAEWFPVEVEISNNGPDLRAVIEWSFPGQSNEESFQRAVDLPRGSQKRVVLNAFSQSFAQNGRVRLLAGNTVLLEQLVRLEVVDPSRFLHAVVSSDPALLNQLNSLLLSGVTPSTVRHLSPASIPDTASSLRGIDVLFLHDVDPATLQNEQRTAIELWVHLGGTLVVSGGLGNGTFGTGLEQLLPVELTGQLSQGSLAGLSAITRTNNPPGDAALSQVTPRPGVTGLPAQDPLIYRWSRGAGSVIFTTFDIAVLRGWNGELDLWGEVLEPKSLFAPGTFARQQRLNPLDMALELPALSLPSSSVLLALMLSYILVIGPINYLVLRRLRRVELAWVTIPLLVVLFTAGFYFVGFGSRGGQAQLINVSVVQGSEGLNRALSTSYLGLFSPRRTSYTLSFSPQALVNNLANRSDSGSEGGNVTTSDTAVEITNLFVDVASVKSLLVETPINLPLQVESQITWSGATPNGTVRNAGNAVLEDALIVRGGRSWPLGNLAPGATIQVNPGNDIAFPSQVVPSDGGSVNRRQLLEVLFDNSTAAFYRRSGISLDDTFFVAWQRVPGQELLINGAAPNQEATTLYYIRLR
jgi:hypothetical protein